LEFETVGRIEDFAEGVLRPVSVDGEPVVVTRIGERFFALSNYCNHVGAPMADGYIYENQAICGYHGAGFNLESGAAERGPAYEPLPVFAVRVVGDEVQVERRRVISQGIPPHLRKVSVQDERQL
jgi:nitrite reductase/ring-hydroxylating ferredoxin subunit